MDMCVPPSTVDSIRIEKPLAEYASFSWLAHLTNCDETQIQKIARIFVSVFDSEITFNWCELCMLLQPSGVERLTIGLDELHEWIITLRSVYDRSLDPDLHFLDGWCSAIKLLFEEFGSILSRKPWEVRILDVGSAFVNLESFCSNCGDNNGRDVNVLLLGSGLEIALRCNSRLDPRLELQRSVLSAEFDGNGYFLLHDEVRDLYFSGPCVTRLRHLSLSVQQSKTGYRLPPCVEIVKASDRILGFESCAMSPNGKFIAIVYEAFSGPENELDSEYGPLTIIREVLDSLDFSKRMHSVPWARVRISHFANCKYLRPTRGSALITDDICLTPSGPTATSDDNITLAVSVNSDERWNNDAVSVGAYFLDYEGNIYVSEETKVGRWQARMFPSCGSSAPNLFSWDEPSWRLVGISVNGRYLIIGDLSAQQNSFHIFDTITREAHELVCPCSDMFFGWLTKFQFCKQDKRLIAFLPCRVAGILIMNVVVWDDVLCSKIHVRWGKLAMSNLSVPIYQVNVICNGDSAHIITPSRFIQDLNLGDEISFPNARGTEDEYPCTIT